ncbi:MAG: hypothetical protein HY332_02970, partial [Chloroflexi bacterium]|nr:hypothetical protein [Chloroflexota bacterium]
MAAIGQVDGARVRATAQPPRVGLVALAAAGVLAAAAAAVLLVVSGQRPAASPTAQDAPAAAGLPAGAGAAGASGAAGAAGAADAATASAPAAGSDRMALRLGGLLLPLENGMRVPAGGDLAAELFFAPYPPAGRTNLDVYVVNERTGQAVADAQVTLRYEMPD